MAGIIPKQTLEEIRFRNDIVDVIGEYLTLKRAGGTFKALCPFHREKTPSFVVNPQRQIFHCFGCGKGGDVFTFIQDTEGIEFTAAVEMLARRAGVPIEFERSGGAPASERDDLFAIHEQVTAFYQRCLRQMRAAEPARRYLAERDLGDDVIEAFQIGYAPDCWDAAIRWGRKHKFAVAQLEKAGLVVARAGDQGRERRYDRFRNRIMFPVHDGQNRIVAFSGRTLEADPRAAKYVNSPETPIFQKSKVLYALSKARRHIVSQKEREAIVCEGQIDVIRCHAAGFETAVASQGTAFTEDHARMLKRFADGAVIVFDPDRAGEDAAIKTAGLFMEAGLAVRVASLPEGQDPDSFIRSAGADAFQKVLDAAGSSVAFQVRVLSARENMNEEIGALRVANAVLAGISRCPSAVQRARLVEIAAESLDVPASALRSDLRRLMDRRGRRAPVEQTAADASPQQAAAPLPREQITLCEHLVQADSGAGVHALVREYLPLRLVTHTGCRAIVEASLEAAADQRDIQDVLRDRSDEDGSLARLAARVLAAPSKMDGGELSHGDAVRHLILRLWRQEFQRERERLAEDGAPDTPDTMSRRMELSCHMNRLKTWEQGELILRIEMAMEPSRAS